MKDTDLISGRNKIGEKQEKSSTFFIVVYIVRLITFFFYITFGVRKIFRKSFKKKQQFDLNPAIRFSVNKESRPIFREI